VRKRCCLLPDHRRSLPGAPPRPSPRNHAASRTAPDLLLQWHLPSARPRRADLETNELCTRYPPTNFLRGAFSILISQHSRGMDPHHRCPQSSRCRSIFDAAQNAPPLFACQADGSLCCWSVTLTAAKKIKKDGRGRHCGCASEEGANADSDVLRSSPPPRCRARSR
jgi:hypothetical protein